MAERIDQPLWVLVILVALLVISQTTVVPEISRLGLSDCSLEAYRSGTLSLRSPRLADTLGALVERYTEGARVRTAHLA